MQPCESLKLEVAFQILSSLPNGPRKLLEVSLGGGPLTPNKATVSPLGLIKSASSLSLLDFHGEDFASPNPILINWLSRSKSALMLPVCLSSPSSFQWYRRQNLQEGMPGVHYIWVQDQKGGLGAKQEEPALSQDLSWPHGEQKMEAMSTKLVDLSSALRSLVDLVSSCCYLPLSCFLPPTPITALLHWDGVQKKLGTP